MIKDRLELLYKRTDELRAKHETYKQIRERIINEYFKMKYNKIDEEYEKEFREVLYAALELDSAIESVLEEIEEIKQDRVWE